MAVTMKNSLRVPEQADTEDLQMGHLVIGVVHSRRAAPSVHRGQSVSCSIWLVTPPAHPSGGYRILASSARQSLE